MRNISHKYTRGESVLAAHLLDPDLERQIEALQRLEPADPDQPEAGRCELEDARERVRATVRTADPAPSGKSGDPDDDLDPALSLGPARG